MVEINKFEVMTTVEVQDRMHHHQTEMVNGRIEGRSARSVRAHTGWYKRLDELHLRRFGVRGDSVLKTPEFAYRHGLRWQGIYLNIGEHHE